MEYVTLEDCTERLFQLAIAFDAAEQTPSYEKNIEGQKKLSGILQQSKNDWYGTCFKKAAYLLTAITKGHVFINGNKRIALLVLLDFLYRNGYRHKSISKESYKRWFKAEWADYKLTHPHLTPIHAWAFYNLSKAVASDDGRSFDVLKKKVESFLDFSMKS